MAKIKCELCGEEIHHVESHLKHCPQAIPFAEYKQRFPNAPLMSVEARERLKSVLQLQTMVAPQTNDEKIDIGTLFRLGNIETIKNQRKEDIFVTRLGAHSFQDMVPDGDPNYILTVDVLKAVLFALEENIPAYLWGHQGSGKSSIIMQICHATNRPMYRIQHTLNMVESDVVGDWRAREGNTYFELGPLPLAMLNGWVLLADEYDRAPPGVVSLYQAVLEGHPLVIKEAPQECRVIRPHPNFRIIGTGNTSGAGDEHGLYAGTLIQDAASYSRFGITYKVGYMDPEAEAALLVTREKVRTEDAKNLVRWATMIRDAFDSGKMGITVSPRELLYAAKVGAAFFDFRKGIKLAITNRFNSVDQTVAEDLAQRVWG